MRIGLFSDTFYPQINGVATSVLLLKEYLEKHGHDVYVFTTTDPKAPSDEKGVVRIPSIPFSKTGRRIGAIIYPSLQKYVKLLGLDIIHTHTEFSVGILGRRVARSLHIPLVHTMHTIYEDYTHYVIKWERLTPINRAVARKLTAAFCNSADKVIVPTDKTRNLLVNYGVKREITVIPTGIKLDKFSRNYWKVEEVEEARKKLGLRKEDKIVVYIGRVSKEKNLVEIINAMKDYLPAHRDVKLVIVGDGPERTRLEMQARELGLNSQVVFTGEQPWDNIGLYYNIGDVFVSASTSETQGLTYIEALAAGLPVIAKKDPSIENVVQNGVNGYVFTDKEEFIYRLDQILSNKSHRDELSNEAVKSSQKFSVDHFGSSVVTLYKTTM